MKGTSTLARFSGADTCARMGASSIHARISGFYSSKPPFTNGLTVRQWLSTQTFEQQYNFGIDKLHELGWRP
jgi:hypothetical protein